MSRTNSEKNEKTKSENKKKKKKRLRARTFWKIRDLGYPVRAYLRGKRWNKRSIHEVALPNWAIKYMIMHLSHPKCQLFLHQYFDQNVDQCSDHPERNQNNTKFVQVRHT